MEVLFAAARNEGVDVHDMDLLFFRTDDGKLSVISQTKKEFTNRVYVSGAIQGVSCDEGFLTVKTQHGSKSFETQFVIS